METQKTAFVLPTEKNIFSVIFTFYLKIPMGFISSNYFVLTTPTQKWLSY